MKGPVEGRDVALVGHGGETEDKVAKDADETEAAPKEGLLELDRKERKDSWRDEVCV